MGQAKSPRFFAEHHNAKREALPSEIDPTHVVDNFFAGSRHTQESEWLVTLDPYGRLQPWVASSKPDLCSDLQSQLAYNEVANSSTARMLATADFYLFHMQLLEQPADAPGLNDPVYLYGTIYGAFPERASEPTEGVEGQLTVTRADLLDAIISGAKYAFQYAPNSNGGRSGRCFNLLLGGDREEETAKGNGLILTYPLLPNEIVSSGTSNEIMIAQILYDVLTLLKQDLLRTRTSNPLCSTVLPVPSRYSMEQDLIAEGYKIKGDVATRNKIVSNTHMSSLLSQVFGQLAQDKLELPPEGTVDELIDIATRTIYKIKGWPPPRTVAVRNRCETVTPEARSRSAGRPAPKSPVIHVPKARQADASDTSTASTVSRASAPTQKPFRVADWMQDFIETHAQNGTAAPIITGANQHPRVSGGSGKTATPAQSYKQKEWEKDFSQDFSQTQNTHRSDSDPQKQKQQQQQQSSAKPDWMKDFE